MECVEVFYVAPVSLPVSLQVRAGPALLLQRLASGLSPVNKPAAALAAIMIATATRLRIVHPWLKRW